MGIEMYYQDGLKSGWRVVKDENHIRKHHRQIDGDLMKDKRYAHVGGEICQNCNMRTKLCWKAPNDIWKKVIGSRYGYLCIPCFDAIAAANGISLAWECKLHPVYSKPIVDVDKDFLKVVRSCNERNKIMTNKFRDHEYSCNMLEKREHVSTKCRLEICPKVNRARDVL